MITYYFTYGSAYSDTAKKRVAYIQKAAPPAAGIFFFQRIGELISSFANDFSNVEYTLCYWLPLPLALGALLLAISIVWIIYNWRMGSCHVRYAAGLRGAYVQDCPNQRKTQQAGHGCKSHAATQINEYLHGMKDLKAYHRTGDGFHALETAMRKLRDESLKEEAVAGSLSTLCSSLSKVHRSHYSCGWALSADRRHTVCFGFCRLSRLSD